MELLDPVDDSNLKPTSLSSQNEESIRLKLLPLTMGYPVICSPLCHLAYQAPPKMPESRAVCDERLLKSELRFWQCAGHTWITRWCPC